MGAKHKYEYITNYTSLNRTPESAVPSVYGRKRRVRKITIHHWGSRGQSFYGVVKYLCRPGGNTSAHEVIEAGKVAVIVDHLDAAWHAGSGEGNAESIGLELRPEATDADYLTAAQRIADLWDFYGEIPLVKHSDWKATACPGDWDLARLKRMARTLRAGKPVIIKPAAPAAPPAHSRKAWPEGLVPLSDRHSEASHAAYVKMLSGVGFKDRKLTTAVQKWLRWNGYYTAAAGYIVDGRWGPMTTRELQRFLKARGHYAGRIDGGRGPLTVRGEIGYINSQARFFRG